MAVRRGSDWTKPGLKAVPGVAQVLAVERGLACWLGVGLTTLSQMDGTHRTVFDNLRSRRGAHSAATSFDRTFAMKTQRFAGHQEATHALVLSLAGVMAISLIASLILLILY